MRKEVFRMNALVAYFSASGTTAKAAKALANAVGGELYEIKPAVPYTNADLNWMDKNSRSSVEMNDEACRPAIAGELPDLGQYDAVFLGFPIWWYVEPRIVDTFLDGCDIAGKALIPFATSGGSGLGRSAACLRSSAPGAKIVDGRMLNGRLQEAELKKWVSGLNL